MKKKSMNWVNRNVCNSVRLLKVATLSSILVFSSCSQEPIDASDDTSALNGNVIAAKIVKLSVGSSSVTATGNDGNVPANTVDGSTATRWAVDGATGQYITYDLGSTKNVTSLKIHWYKGNTRKAFFQIRTGNSTSSLVTSYDAKYTGSNGTTSGFETYTLSPAVNARYVRISVFGNSDSSWNSIIETEIYGDDGGVVVTPPPTGSSPAAVLGITSSTWKINSFRGTPGSSAVYYDDITDASGVSFNTYSDPNFFYTDGSWTYFKCYRGLGGSENSDNPRVELRELIGGNEANWNGSSGTHTMTWTVKVDKLPKGESGTTGTLCFGQIHGPERNSNGVEVDDAIRVQFEGTANQSTGAVKLKISGYITEEVLGGSRTFTGYSLGTSYTFTLKYTGGKIYLYNGTSLVFSQQMDTSADGNYFKVGNYLQSVKGMSYDGSYGLVAIKGLKVTH